MHKTRCCFIHVGTHKTGTTSIQALLRDNAALFALNGVLIPQSGRGDDGAGHHNLSQQLLGGSQFRPDFGGLAELTAELRATHLPAACISSEDFSLASRSLEALAALRDAVADAGFTPVIVVFLRPQVQYCVSIYAEIIKNGYGKPFAQYLDEIRSHHSFVWNGVVGPICRYDILLDRFSAVFGACALIVRRYSGRGDMRRLLRQFAHVLVGQESDLTGLMYPPERYNPSLSFPAVLRKLGSTDDLVDMRFAPLTLRQTVELARRFDAPNRTVARRFGVRIPPCEFTDLLAAQPLRKTPMRTRSLAVARRLLRSPLPSDVSKREAQVAAAVKSEPS